MKLQANDSDAGSFGTVWYTQVTDTAGGNLFLVDRMTGQIRLNGSFSSAAIPRSTSVSLLACDNAGMEPTLCSDVRNVSVYFVGEENLVVITVAESLDTVTASQDKVQRCSRVYVCMCECVCVCV